jgi:RNA polymerase sigma factor (sigma-70 family)
MPNNDPQKTSRSLLCRLKDWRDHQAWITFLKRYGDGIGTACRRHGLPPDAAAEVKDRVLFKLPLRLRKFVYEPKLTFRGWLGRLVRNEVIDFRRQNARLPFVQGSGDSVVQQRLLEQLAAPAERPEDAEINRQRSLQKLAATIENAVRTRVDPETWQAFWLTEIEGLTTKEAAAKLGKTFAATYMAALRVRGHLRREGEKHLQEYSRRRAIPAV